MTPNQIRDTRLSLGLSVRDMAEALRIRHVTYGEYERGVLRMSDERIREIKTVFRNRGWTELQKENPCPKNT
jgi:transcriptional regulator with XRE-family HTH domain